MRLSIAVNAALCGLATANTEADVYLLRSEPAPRQAAPPQLQRQLARLIFQQRLGVDGSFSSAAELSSLPSSYDAVSHLNAYGRPEAPLFSEGGAAEPSQLMVILEGLEPSQMGDFVPGQDKAFVIDDVPNAAANGKLVDGEFGAAGVAASSCPFERAINPLDTDCWSGSSSIIRYDAKKDKNIVKALQKAAPKLTRFAETGEMETTLVLVPESSRNSPVNSWSSHPAELRRRQSETLLSSDESPVITPSEPNSAASSPSQAFPGLVDRGSVSECYATYNSCVAATANCSGHGLCYDLAFKFDDDGNVIEPKEGTAICFACQCKGTRGESGSVTRWAGDKCDKVDYSVPFALFLGFTIFMLAIVVAAVKLVYSIGEEDLPGVLSAGVSKKTN